MLDQLILIEKKALQDKKEEEQRKLEEESFRLKEIRRRKYWNDYLENHPNL